MRVKGGTSNDTLPKSGSPKAIGDSMPSAPASKFPKGNTDNSSLPNPPAPKGIRGNVSNDGLPLPGKQGKARS